MVDSGRKLSVFGEKQRYLSSSRFRLLWKWTCWFLESLPRQDGSLDSIQAGRMQPGWSHWLVNVAWLIMLAIGMTHLSPASATGQGNPHIHVISVALCSWSRGFPKPPDHPAALVFELFLSVHAGRVCLGCLSDLATSIRKSCHCPLCPTLPHPRCSITSPLQDSSQDYQKIPAPGNAPWMRGKQRRFQPILQTRGEFLHP